MNSVRILIIDDEPDISNVLSYNLKNEQFEVSTAKDGVEGIRLAAQLQPDLVLLDLMLPGMDGLQVCRKLRGEPKTRHVKIMMLTAKGDEVDEIVGFNMGADDYVAKPFRVKALIHRIKALLRRGSEAAEGKELLRYEGVEIDREKHQVLIDGAEVLMTPTEFRLLWEFARNPGRTFSRSELMDRCRGEDANALERTIDVHIRSLRSKMGEEARLIQTVRGVGYRFRAEGSRQGVEVSEKTGRSRSGSLTIRSTAGVEVSEKTGRSR